MQIIRYIALPTTDDEKEEDLDSVNMQVIHFVARPTTDDQEEGDWDSSDSDCSCPDCSKFPPGEIFYPRPFYTPWRPAWM